jgi:hypothetical protein
VCNSLKQRETACNKNRLKMAARTIRNRLQHRETTWVGKPAENRVVEHKGMSDRALLQRPKVCCLLWLAWSDTLALLSDSVRPGVRMRISFGNVRSGALPIGGAAMRKRGTTAKIAVRLTAEEEQLLKRA